MDVPLRCACGSVWGRVRGLAAGGGRRIVCYCDDCQSFAHYLGDAGRILDARGGTEILHTSPARLELAGGTQHLACVRLRPNGILRWYAGCCRTPIGNTPASRQLPFIGLIHSCLDVSSAASRDELLGPVRARIFGRFARGGPGGLDAHGKVPVSLMLRFLGGILAARLRGDHLRSPLFRPETGEPRAAPHVLDEQELRAVEAARDAA